MSCDSQPVGGGQRDFAEIGGAIERGELRSARKLVERERKSLLGQRDIEGLTQLLPYGRRLATSGTDHTVYAIEQNIRYLRRAAGEQGIQVLRRRSSVADAFLGRLLGVLCDRPLAIRVVGAAVLWPAVNAALLAAWSVKALNGSDLVFFVVLAVEGAITFGVGYVVGSWWALAGPVLATVPLVYLLVRDASNDPGFGLAFWLLAIMFGVIVVVVRAGMGARRRFDDRRRAPQEPGE